MIKANVGGVDRIIRAAVGLILIGLTLAGQLGVWASIVGVVVLLTAVFKFCLAYPILGVSTCPMQKKE